MIERHISLILKLKIAVKCNSSGEPWPENFLGEIKMKIYIIIAMILLYSYTVFAQTTKNSEPFVIDVTREMEYYDKDGKYIGRCTVTRTATTCYDKNGKIISTTIIKKQTDRERFGK
jgi:hypothetical protein